MIFKGDFYGAKLNEYKVKKKWWEEKLDKRWLRFVWLEVVEIDARGFMWMKI